MKNTYKVGDIIGNYGCQLIKINKGNSSERPKHLFSCGKCGKSFSSIMAHIANNNTSSCGCLKLKDHFMGELVGPYKHVLLKELERKSKTRRFLLLSVLFVHRHLIVATQLFYLAQKDLVDAYQ